MSIRHVIFLYLAELGGYEKMTKESTIHLTKQDKNTFLVKFENVPIECKKNIKGTLEKNIKITTIKAVMNVSHTDRKNVMYDMGDFLGIVTVKDYNSHLKIRFDYNKLRAASIKYFGGDLDVDNDVDNGKIDLLQNFFKTNITHLEKQIFSQANVYKSKYKTIIKR
jgi:hypothetical protein